MCFCVVISRRKKKRVTTDEKLESSLQDDRYSIRKNLRYEISSTLSSINGFYGGKITWKRNGQIEKRRREEKRCRHKRCRIGCTSCRLSGCSEPSRASFDSRPWRTSSSQRLPEKVWLWWWCCCWMEGRDGLCLNINSWWMNVSVTGVAGRLFGAWTTVSTMVRFSCAMAPHERQLQLVGMGTFLVAGLFQHPISLSIDRSCSPRTHLVDVTTNLF